ncbi:MAG: BrnT family toxin [Candidatus Latescibacteria bacterium]|nr:BrnT family toxin [Candidatus Latescibacterota bacterium]
MHELLRGRQQVYFVEKGDVEGEHLYLALGQTASGRYLAVFFVYKKNKDVLVVSARDMAAKERKRYEKG